MVSISASWWYILSTLSAVSRGETLKGLAAVASSPPPLAAGRGSHLLGLSLSGGEFHHQDPLRLVCGLAPRWWVRLNRGSGLHADKLASLWRCPLLGGRLLSAGLRLLPPMTSTTSLEREAGFWPCCRHPRGNCHHDLSGRSVIHPWCGCDGSEGSPIAAPSGRGEAEAPLPS
jgi:hypothetical protein